MKKTISILALCMCVVLYAQSQNTFPATGRVGIGTTSPNATALLEVKSTTQGLLTPRMTQAQRDAIGAPAIGLLIYQTNNTPGFYYYAGSAWKAVTASAGSGSWLLNGNTGIAGSAFLGTTDSKALIFKTQNKERIHIRATGEVGIGTPLPAAKLQVDGGGPASLTGKGFIVQ